ncbi:hypothetical protein [Pelagibacterium sp. H642]|uniref:hypothetical protein n=1 Tax=Pelagibacterium sp. H642 TaxID=1881069 RepID=UPI002814B84C|nr:hypothetical protein [Pelagibacterium sp. H642]WMT90572.1 hypothetical protein NO934_17620 [Pelagibacterium sp. H642]
MDNTKHNQSAAAQDSDDLIAELARLVAQDARNTSTRSDAYRREEPQFAPEPEPAEPVQSDFDQAEQSFGVPDRGEPQAEPEWGTREESQQADDELAGFDFGFDTAPQQGASTSQDDPIAELIADAEVEAYDRDFSQEDSSWPEDTSQELQPQDEEVASQRHDDFTVSAVAQPSVSYTQDRDPLSEIEALIGEAARVNSGDAGFSGRRVRSSFLDDTPTDEAVNTAESAILAAAAATGATVRRHEPAVEPETWPTPQEAARDEFHSEPMAGDGEFTPAAERIPDPLFAASRDDAAPETRQEDYEYDEEEVAYDTERPRRRINGFVLPIAAGVAVVALIGGMYFTFFSGPPEPGEAPVLTADAQPLKEDVEPAPDQTAANDSVVFNEIEGNTAAPEEEALVSRDQTGGASGAEVAQVLAPEEGETELANRPVRTVTVRPDGTIVQADDSVAGSNVLPVERPDVPAVPNSTLTADPIGEAIAEAMAGGETAEATGAEQVAALNAPASALGDAATGATAQGATTDLGDAATDEATVVEGDATAPRPIPRPAGLTAPTNTAASAAPAAPAPAESTVALAPTQAQTPAAPAPATSAPANVGAWVQLSSQRTEEDARGGIPTLQARYGALFNGATPEVSRVDLGERGIYYRVRLPQPTLAEANSVCGAILAQGGDCFVMDN